MAFSVFAIFVLILTWKLMRSLISLLWIHCDSWAHIRAFSIFFLLRFYYCFFKLARDCPLLISPSSPERILPDVTLLPKNLDELICVGWQIERKPRKSAWTTERVELLLNILKSSRLNHITCKLLLEIKGKFRSTAAKCLSCADFVCALLTGHVVVF